MEFEYYNPSDESRSCVVRTMTKLTGKEYSTVKAELTAYCTFGSFDYYSERAFPRASLAASMIPFEL